MAGDTIKNATALGSTAATSAATGGASNLTAAEQAAIAAIPLPAGSQNLTQQQWTELLKQNAEKIKTQQLEKQTRQAAGPIWQSGLDGTGGDAPNVVTPNVLRNYTNYTYNLSWHILTNEQFNSMVKNPSDYAPKNVLVASAGAMIKNRVPEFREDFYFDGLSLTTIIGLNARSRESNAIDLNFNIVEPYGCSLLDKLIEVTQRLVTGSADKGNYLTMPYMLQIDFFGYDDKGSPQKINHTKYLPIKLIEMKVKPDASGTRYQIRAVPYHHQIYRQSIGVIPANLEITAKDLKRLFTATGQDNLSTTVKTAQQNANQVREQAIQNYTRGREASGQDTKSPEAQAEIRAAGDSVYATELSAVNKQIINVASVGDALNNWNNFLVKEKLIEKPDQFVFEFAEEIGNSPLVLEKKQTEKKQAPGTTNEDIKQGKAPTQGAKSAISNSSIYAVADSQNMYRVNAGSSIVNLIDLCVRNSEYIRKQIKDANDRAAESANKDSRDSTNAGDDTPLKWFKITAEVTNLGDFDRIRNEFSKTITYRINIYEVTNVKYPFVTQKKAIKWSKEYNYFYTGKNSDVVGVDINFDTMFYTAVSTNPNRFKETNQVPDFLNTAQADKKSDLCCQTGVPFPKQHRPIVQLADLTAAGYATRDAKTMAVSDLTNSLMNNSRGDMLSLKLEIIGDPDFIKQDDLFHTRTAGAAKVNNSIGTDDGQINVKLNFKLPHDWTREKGLLTPSTDTVFDGLYRVLRVDSNFERGIFKQSLEMIRLYDDEADLARRNQQATDYSNSGVDESGEAAADNSGIVVNGPVEDGDLKDDYGKSLSGVTNNIEPQSLSDELPPLGNPIVVAPAPVLNLDITGDQ